MTQALVMFCMVATPFKADGSLDEGALRSHLSRLVDANNGVYLAGGGAGEGHALSRQELRRICEIGVEMCKGKVPTYCNPREARSAEEHYLYAREAAAAGVDVVQLYQLEGGHGMKPTPEEQNAYWAELLDALRYPVAISIHSYAGFYPSADYLRHLKDNYPQIVALNLIAMPSAYLTEVRDAMPADVAIYTHVSTVVQGLALGAAGALQAESNLIPNTCRRLLDQWASEDIAGMRETAQHIQRLSNVVNEWAPSTARWVKMGMRVLDCPGGQGPLRKPYLMPDAAAQRKMADSFKAIGVREWEALPTAGAKR